MKLGSDHYLSHVFSMIFLLLPAGKYINGLSVSLLVSYLASYIVCTPRPTIRGGLEPFSMPYRRWGLENLQKSCGGFPI